MGDSIQGVHTRVRAEMAGSGRVPRSPRASAVGARAAQAYNGAIRAQLADLQRARILSAMFDVAYERGASNVTVAHVVQRSGVSRRTFYEVFENRDDCFLAAFDEALAYASERVLTAYRSREKWHERIRAGLVEFLSFIDGEPVISRLLVAESLTGGAKTLRRRGEVIALLTDAIDAGREEAKPGSQPPAPLAAEGVLGGALAVIHTRLLQADRESLVELVNPLMAMIVLPYLGSGTARRELERLLPTPSVPVRSATLLSDPFKDAGIRLTYRTVRVLMAIAEHEGASNRTIADTAEISDQGQISKLLGRLQRIGLVSNTGVARGQGGPNAWTLTSSGRQVVNSIRAHTADSEQHRAGPIPEPSSPNLHRTKN
jgi:AcrR family transcriptional regulator